MVQFAGGILRGMKARFIIFALMMALITGSMSVQPAQAQSPFRNNFSADEARKARKQGQVLGASEVLRIVQQRYPHLRAADARLVQNLRAAPQYHVKMLSPDNRVVEVIVDARTGRILGTRGN